VIRSDKERVVITVDHVNQDLELVATTMIAQLPEGVRQALEASRQTKGELLRVRYAVGHDSAELFETQRKGQLAKVASALKVAGFNRPQQRFERRVGLWLITVGQGDSLPPSIITSAMRRVEAFPPDCSSEFKLDGNDSNSD